MTPELWSAEKIEMLKQYNKLRGCLPQVESEQALAQIELLQAALEDACIALRLTQAGTIKGYEAEALDFLARAAQRLTARAATPDAPALADPVADITPGEGGTL